MLIERLWVGSRLRNYNYLVACEETRDALAIDPLDVEQCLDVANERDWSITQILNTHEHHDHVGGNEALRKATGAPVIAHENADIEKVDRRVTAGDTIEVGSSVVLRCLDTPGHTMSHICLLSDTEPPALFSGDTLFNAGAGNCHNGGHPEELYKTFRDQISALPDDTRVYPGHDYLLNNLGFTLDREPNNEAAKELQERLKKVDPEDMPVLTLAEEREINCFLRLDQTEIADKLEKQFGTKRDPKSVFLKLRELRNRW